MALKSNKQRAFVQEYLIDLNATQAAIRAGYSPLRADATAYNLLRNTEIQKAIQKAMEDRAERTGISQDRVLKEYAKIAFVDPRKFFDAAGNLIPVHELDDDTAACIAGMDILTRHVKGQGGEFEPETTKKIKIADKIKALQDVGKHIGFFGKDNDQKVPKNIEVKLVE